MELQKIKSFCEKREGGVKRLASDIGMSEANLHRCIRNNQIQAGDLEKIASELGVDVSVFFDSIPSTVSTGEFSPVNINGTMEVSQTTTKAEPADTAALRAVSAKSHRPSTIPMETINDRIECIVNDKFNGNKSSFAKAIGLDRFTIGNYIGSKRRSKPPVDIICKIVSCLHVDAYWLLTGEGDMMKDEAAEQRIVVQDNNVGGTVSVSQTTISENSREIELLRTQIEEKERTILILQQFIEELKKR